MKNSQDILQQLSDIPLLLLDATQKWKFFPRDQRLKATVQQFFETVLDALSTLIHILLRKHKDSTLSCESRSWSSKPSRYANNTVA